MGLGRLDSPKTWRELTNANSYVCNRCQPNLEQLMQPADILQIYSKDLIHPRWVIIFIMVECKEQQKKDVRFFNEREVRAVWDEEQYCWWFSATDIIRAINNKSDYTKAGITGDGWKESWEKKVLNSWGALTDSNLKLLMENNAWQMFSIVKAFYCWQRTIPTIVLMTFLTGLPIVIYPSK